MKTTTTFPDRPGSGWRRQAQVIQVAMLEISWLRSLQYEPCRQHPELNEEVSGILDAGIRRVKDVVAAYAGGAPRGQQ